MELALKADVSLRGHGEYTKSLEEQIDVLRDIAERVMFSPTAH
ncbi:MAG: hypothetical protein AABX10_03175 [Nanoarchaeota archaeon]